MRKVKISLGLQVIEGELNDSPTADAIWNALPFTSEANIWGDEVYFRIPLARELDHGAVEEVDEGALGYWPIGNAFCIFFGPTPVSKTNKPRAYSPINVIGNVAGSLEVLKSVKDGDAVTVDKM